VLGGTMLVDSPAGFQRISLGVVVPVALATALVTVFLVGNIVKTHRNRVQTGLEGLTGMQAVAEADFSPQDGQFAGTARVHGEIWKAVSPTPVAAGEAAEVQGREGLTLLVRFPARPSTPPAQQSSPE
jgi:membrane-bound serine protease (ClpP class)